MYIAWTLIAGVNDSDDHAQRLGQLLRGQAMHINLIPLNPIDEYAPRAPDDQRTQRFQELLKASSGLPVTLRQKRGIGLVSGVQGKGTGTMR